jgi:pimeloyl-ACP methyl ester carboxylesterase
MPSTKRSGILDLVLAVLALAGIAAALWHLLATTAGLSVETMRVGDTPVTVYRPPDAPRAPVVVIAHGFAGSQQLMQPFAVTMARNGYVAVTFDFQGHGRNPVPLTGNVTKAEGATRALVEQTGRIIAFARPLGDRRLAVLGHSMASDIAIRTAQAAPDIAATIAVSAFSPVVTATSPRNLLLIVGDWEGFLKTEALRLTAQVSAPEAARKDVTYGDFAAGTARRATFSPHVEHVGVLYSQHSMAEALAWVDGAFGITRTAAAYHDARGLWIMLLLASIVVLARPLSRFLPAVSPVPLGAGLGWRQIWPVLLLPALLTPIILRFLPTHFLPVIVGDYLAVHFALYGLLSALGIRWVSASRASDAVGASLVKPLIAATVLAIACTLIGLGVTIDTFVTSFAPTPNRVPLIGALLVGTLCYFLANEWLTRGMGAARGSYAVSQMAFVASLALAIVLDFNRLFFLIIIVPVIIPFFLVYGLLSQWCYGRTQHPFVAGVANAVSFAWAIGVTFPMLAA